LGPFVLRQLGEEWGLNWHEVRATGVVACLTIGRMRDEVYVFDADEQKRRPRLGERTVGPAAGEFDRAIAELAERQHGVVARRQLLELGLGTGGIASRIRRGNLHRLHQGVYAVGHLVLTRDGRWMAAALAVGPEAVLSHRSAGVLWGLIPAWTGEIEVTTPSRVRARQGICVRRSAFADDERTEVDGIPVTSPFRTLLDLAGVLKMRQLELAWNELEVRGLTDSMPLRELMARYLGRRGSANLRALLEGAGSDGVTRNEFEESFIGLIDAHGLPRPRVNADLKVRDRFFEVDCLWERERLAVELDGGAHRTRRRFESDRQRDRMLIAEGWRTARVTWRQLRDEPDAVIADLHLALQPPGPSPTPTR
jgi:very-short-patch-repair endonuclease